MAAIIPNPSVYSHAALRAQPESVPSFETPALVHLPITLGVALLLQAAAFTLLCVLGALGYIGLEIKGHEDAQAVQRSLTREIAQLEASLAGTRRTLDAIQRTLATQAQPNAVPAEAAIKLTPQAKVARVKAPNNR
ncbi:MAG: hypothetical protein RL701_126 [Pseudomonadota bacterium]|jgi:hypothetical protein